MSERFHARVILCWPSAPKDIARLNRLTDSQNPFVPTVEHSLSRCDSCDRGIWISKQQLQMTRNPLFRNNKLCMFCVNDIHKTLNVELREVDIAPQISRARRRLA